MYTKDNFHVYYQGNVMDNVNPFKFELLGKGYAKDSFNVYYEGKIMKVFHLLNLNF